jgi:serine/threonine protein kinase
VAEVVPSDELTSEPSEHSALRPGSRLGRYELLVPVARGGMARVWAARQLGQRGFQKIVAIKVILPHLAREADFERMFLDEARIASCVHHPNVCDIYELGEENRTLYIAMEWVNGDSLSRLLRPGVGATTTHTKMVKSDALDPRIVARIVADACAGIHAAHELTDEDGRRKLEVVHRDVSPQNLLLTTDGVVKVCDFGVAKAFGQVEESSKGQLKGKISYMAPEQIAGEPIDRRSDIFALGCVLYEATTGQRPFKGELDHHVMRAIMNSELEPPSSVLRSYPAELEKIVLRALAHQPILRYPTAERMRVALEEFLTKGQLVTQTNVAQLVRSRIGDHIEKRRERIRQAQTAADQAGGGTWDPGTTTGGSAGGASREVADQRSGIKASAAFGSTLQLGSKNNGASGPARDGLPSLADEPAGPDRTVAMATTMLEPNSEAVPTPMTTTLPHVAAAEAIDMPPASQDLPTIGYARSPVDPPPDFATTLPVALEARLGGDAEPRTLALAPGYTAPGGSSPPERGSAPPNFAVTAPVAGPKPWNNEIPVPIAAPAPSFVPRPAWANEEEEDVSEPGGAKQYLIAALLGLFVAALIGVVVWFVWQSRVEPTAEAPPPKGVATPGPPPGSAAAAGSTAASGASGASARANNAGADASISMSSTEVVLRISPVDAKVTADGKELPVGGRVVTRPAAGKAITVLARAKGYEDATISIDYFTVSPVDLKMKPGSSESDNAPATTPSPPTPPPTSARPHGKARPKEPSIPDNPY